MIDSLHEDHLFHATADGAACTSLDGLCKTPTRRYLKPGVIEIQETEIYLWANGGARTRTVTNGEVMVEGTAGFFFSME